MQDTETTPRTKFRLTKIEKIFTLVGTILLVATFFLPIWRIDIWAPQYPEGLSMTIHLNKMGGNIDQVNILNHYIGMKAIVPDAIPEMKVMPYVMAALIGLGLLTLLTARRWMAMLWFGLISLAGVVGFYDFYKWGYDYGHNLDPDAPIKVPGMTYQPPLIGGKTILNIDAYSLPDTGGIALALAVGCIFLSFMWSRIAAARNKRKHDKTTIVSSALLVFLTLAGCTSKPEPIHVHEDSCATCKMQIADLRFGGEIRTKKGRVYKFDSIPCLTKFRKENAGETKAVWVLDYFAPGSFVEAEKARFLHSPGIQGPMGYGVVASADRAKLTELRKDVKGELLGWEQVVALDL